MKKDVSIIIINYQTPQLCIECIESIIKYSHRFNYEIILVDNGSKDNSLKILSKKLPSSVILIESKQNLGFGRANNLAAKYAKGRYLFLLNSDTLLIENSIYYLKQCLDESPKAMCAGAMLINKEGKMIHSYSTFPSMKTSLKVASSPLKHYFFKRKTKKTSHPKVYPKEIFKIDYITGADLLIKKEAWDKCKGFDTNIFMYFEESDLQLRISQMGYHSIINPNTKIIHLEGQSLKISNFKRIIYNRSMLYYMKKHNTLLKFIIFKSMLYLIYSFTHLFIKIYSPKEHKEFIKLFTPLKHQSYIA